MRPTEEAHHDFQKAITYAANEASLKDVKLVVYSLLHGLDNIAFAIRQTYEKLEQIDQKLSSASTHRRPTM